MVFQKYLRASVILLFLVFSGYAKQPVVSANAESDKKGTIYLYADSSLDKVSDQVICHDQSTAAINFIGDFDRLEWTNDNTSIGLAPSGNSNIPSFIAINTGTSAAIATITVTPYDELDVAGNDMVFTITVNPLPDAPTTGGDQTICADETIPPLFVTVGAGETADWYDAAPGGTLLASGTTSYTPTAAGTYYAEARNTTTDCVSTTRTDVTLTINPIPTVSASPLSQEICPGSAITPIDISNPNSTPGTTYTYEWFDSPDATGNLVGTTATYKPPAAGNYSIRVRDIPEGVLCSEYVYNFLVAPDDSPPVITPPVDLVLECNDPTNLQQIQDWLSLATAVDDNTPNLTPGHDFIGIDEYCNAELIVTFWAVDECGNRGEATARIIIIDTQAPVLMEVPEPIIVGPDPVTCDVDQNDVNLVAPWFTDQCDDDASLTITHDAPATFPPGETIVTWTATDACGNTASVIQSVTVLDPDPPSVECPPNVTVPSAVDDCGAIVTVPPPNVTDPCPHTIANDSPYRTSDTDASGFYPIGTTIVTWTITGISGNVATCVQEITVTDLDPWVNCPDPIEVAADFGLPYNDALVVPAPTFGDNCPDPALSWTMTPPVYYAGEYLAGDLSGTGNHPSPQRFYVGVSTITFTVTDSHGNTATCFFTITQPTLIELMVTNINPSVPGYADGSATVQATGGTPPYTYLWSDGQTTPEATGLIAGTYTVVITDANGCVVSGEVTITDPILSYTLTVETSPGGLVHVNGFDYENPMTFYHGNMPELLAMPDEGWQFDGWSGNLSGTDNPDYLLMDDNKTVTATFSEIQPENYTLEVIIEGNGHFLVNGHTYTETLTFTDGTELLVEAIPEVDWVFKRWEGDINSNDSLINLLMDGDKDLVAVFSEKPLYSVSFAIKDEVGEPIHDAYINFNGVNYPPSMYNFGGLKQGNYPYIVLRSGYFNTQGAVQVTNVDVTLSVVLNKDNTFVRDKETRSLKVYPNPAKDSVIIEAEEPILQISILNVMGQLLHVETINGEQLIHLSLPNLDNGLYILHVQGQESLNTKLLLIGK